MAVAFDAFTAITAGVNPSGTHTPVGTPRGVLVLAGTNVADTPTVTYGGTSMGSPVASLDVVNAAEVTDFVFKAWLLGSSVPTGAQTVTMSSAANGSTLHVYTVTAANNVEFITSASDDDLSISNVAATLTLGGRTVFAALIGASGENTDTAVTPLTNWTSREEMVVGGTYVHVGYSYNIIGSTDITAGWTQSSDDAAFLAVAISEVVAGTSSVMSKLSQMSS